MRSLMLFPKPLPVFYISLDKNLSTPQRISSHIHNRAVMAEIRNKIHSSTGGHSCIRIKEIKSIPETFT